MYAGCQDGYVKVLDLETRTLVRTIIVNEVSHLYLFDNSSSVDYNTILC